MMIPSIGSRWDLDAASFHDAARNDWPEAELSEPVAAGNGNTVVMISTSPGHAGRPLSAILQVQPDKDGSFNVQAGSGPEAAGMFAWFRTWLGPHQTAAILNAERANPIIDVPSGATPQEILPVLQSLS